MPIIVKMNEEYYKYHQKYYKNNKEKVNNQFMNRCATNEDVREKNIIILERYV